MFDLHRLKEACWTQPVQKNEQKVFTELQKKFMKPVQQQQQRKYHPAVSFFVFDVWLCTAVGSVGCEEQIIPAVA